MIFIKPKFRIREEKMGSGKSKFFPQERKWFLWWNFVDVNQLSSQTTVWFLNKHEAENFLAQHHKDLIADKIVKRETHPFDAVHHALKNE